MRGMRLRVAILLSLLVIGGLLSGIQPVQASGPWALELTLICQAKWHPKPGENPGLGFATLGPILTASYSVLCGKPHSGVHNKHTFTNIEGANIPNVCWANEIDALGKKPDPKLPRAGLLQNIPGLAKTLFVGNCLLLALATATGFCEGASAGTVGGAVHTKDVNGVWKLVFFTGSWPSTFLGILPITGSAGKVLALLRLSTGGPYILAAAIHPRADGIHKGDSCITGDGHAQNFLFEGAAVIATTAK